MKPVLRGTVNGPQIFLRISRKLPQSFEIASLPWDPVTGVEGKEYGDCQTLATRSMTKEAQRWLENLR